MALICIEFRVCCMFHFRKAVHALDWMLHKITCYQKYRTLVEPHTEDAHVPVCLLSHCKCAVKVNA